MITKTVDTPGINLREVATIVSLTITPTMLFAEIVITSSDLGTNRVLGTRIPVKPPLAPGLPAPRGVLLTSLPNNIQNHIDQVAAHFINEPGLFN